MQTGNMKTADGLTLRTLDAPVTGAKGIVYIVHGIGEHIGRYMHVVQYLNGCGYAVYGHDHRGHGQSDGERVYFATFDTPVNDLHSRIAAVKAQHPGIPVVVWGHSMGSLIATLYVERFQDSVRGFISTGSPLWVDKKIPGAVQFVLRQLAKVARRMPLLPVEPEAVSRDPAVVAAYTADPYVNHEKTTLGMAVSFAEATARARTELERITAPTLILHGTADTLTPIKGSEALRDGIRSTDKTYVTFDGLYHELHNEPEQADVFAVMRGWLDAHCAAGAPRTAAQPV